jgi:hypothetical protein
LDKIGLAGEETRIAKFYEYTPSRDWKLKKGKTLMITRRSFIKMGGVAGTGLVLPWKGLTAEPIGRVAGPTLDPTLLPKYVTPLVIPPAMPATLPDYYEIAVRQFHQQVLPSGWPATKLWSYGSVKSSGQFQLPSLYHRSKG